MVSTLQSSDGLALGEIGDSRALPALMEAMQDPSELVREAVALALKEIDAKMAFLAA